jgi:hypothetical protein
MGMRRGISSSSPFFFSLFPSFSFHPSFILLFFYSFILFYVIFSFFLRDNLYRKTSREVH